MKGRWIWDYAYVSRKGINSTTTPTYIVTFTQQVYKYRKAECNPRDSHFWVKLEILGFLPF